MGPKSLGPSFFRKRNERIKASKTVEQLLGLFKEEGCSYGHVQLSRCVHKVGKSGPLTKEEDIEGMRKLVQACFDHIQSFDTQVKTLHQYILFCSIMYM